MGTIFAVLMGVLGALTSSYYPELWQSPQLSFFFGVIFIPLAVVQWIILSLAFIPLHRAEQDLTPRIFELFKKDRVIFWSNQIAIILCLLVFVVIFYAKYLPFPPFIFWLVVLGISFDLLYYFVKRILGYLNPYAVTKMFTEEAKNSILQSRELDLCGALDALSEISLKSLHRSSTSLCQYSLDEMGEVMRLQLEAPKDLAVSDVDKQAQAKGINDKVSYTLYYFFDRIERTYYKALDLQLTQVCSRIITLLGKVVFYAARCDLSLVSHVVGVIGKFSKDAEEKGFPEIALKGTCTLSEVAKLIVNEIDLRYMDLKDPFFSMITQLDEVGKVTFRRNKSTSIPMLVAPLKDLKTLFQTEKVANCQDTPVIVAEVDRVLAEWDALDNVLRTIPPLAPLELIKTEEQNPTT